jgi:hypothetical protein
MSPGEDTRLTGFDESLETAVGQEGIPSRPRLLGIEVAEGARLEQPSVPARSARAAAVSSSAAKNSTMVLTGASA